MYLIKVAVLAGIIAGAGVIDAHAGLHSYGTCGFPASATNFRAPSLSDVRLAVVSSGVVAEASGSTSRTPGGDKLSFAANQRANLTLPFLSLPGRFAAGLSQS